MIVSGLKCLRRSLPLLLITGILCACGQTGALYLPEEPQEQAPPHQAGTEAGDTENDTTSSAETNTEAAPETNQHQH